MIRTREDGLYFPDMEFYMSYYGLRGHCGKKNCLSEVQSPGSEFSVSMFLGGSGMPNIDVVEEVREGLEIPWEYNNMISHSDEFGWIVLRLDEEKKSFAQIDRLPIEEQSILTATKVELFLKAYVPGSELSSELSLEMGDPIRLELSSTPTPAHFKFRSTSPCTFVDTTRAPVLEFTEYQVDVTSSRLVSIRDVNYENYVVTFTVDLDICARDLEPPIVWFIHNPCDSHGIIPFGEMRFENGFSERLSVDISEFDSLRECDQLFIEVISLKDEHHLWNIAEVSAGRDIRELEEKIRKLEKERRKLRREYRELEKEIKRLIKTQERLPREIRSLEEEQGRLPEEIKRLRKKLEKRPDEAREIQRKINRLEKKHEELPERIKKLKEKQEELPERIKKLKEKMRGIEEQIEKLEDEIRELLEKIKKLQE
jgi:hypothetical protein